MPTIKIIKVNDAELMKAANFFINPKFLSDRAHRLTFRVTIKEGGK